MGDAIVNWMRAATLAGAAVFCFCNATAAGAAESSSGARKEIAHLLNHLQQSGCQFFRDGVWHEAAAAKAHLDRKYKYLLDRGMIGNAEDFIRLAASTSSMKGTEYRVRCQGGTPVASRVWLGDELVRYRVKEVARN